MQVHMVRVHSWKEQNKHTMDAMYDELSHQHFLTVTLMLVTFKEQMQKKIPI